MFQFLVETVAILLFEGFKKKKNRILFYCHFIFLIALAQSFQSENHCKCYKKLKWPTLFTYTDLFFCYTYFVLLHNKIKICFIHTIAANKGQSTVNYCQSLAFDHPYLSCNDHCGWWLFQEIFLLSLLLFCINFLERFWTCFLGIAKHLKQLFLMRDYFYFTWQLQGIDIRLCYL